MNDTKLYRKYTTKVAEMINSSEYFPIHRLCIIICTINSSQIHTSKAGEHILRSPALLHYNNYSIAYPLRATTFFTKSITTGDG